MGGAAGLMFAHGELQARLLLTIRRGAGALRMITPTAPVAA